MSERIKLLLVDDNGGTLDELRSHDLYTLFPLAVAHVQHLYGFKHQVGQVTVKRPLCFPDVRFAPLREGLAKI